MPPTTRPRRRRANRRPAAGAREEVAAIARRVCREHRADLLRVAHANAATPSEAEDAVQQALVSFLERFDPAGSAPPLPWLVLNLKRKCWAMRRSPHLTRRQLEPEPREGSRSRRDRASELPSAAVDPQEAVAAGDEVRGRLAALRPAERRVISLLACGFSYRETGAIAGYSQRKVDRCACRGRARLRAHAA
jgi:DNA-directed RNA polymerase specialized sigma24 family protein